MTQKSIRIFFIMIVGIIACAMQANASEVSTNWGESIYGVQLSINMTNNVIARGRTILLAARIKNTSTNYIQIAESNPMTEFSIFLINSSGKSNKISPDSSGFEPRFFALKIKAGQTFEFSVPVNIETNIEPGKYTLKATRYILTADSKHYELASNLLNVEIK